LRIPIQHHALDLRLHRRIQFANTRHDCGSLTGEGQSTTRTPGRRCEEVLKSKTHLYPPATIAASGHCVCANANNRAASCNAAVDVPPGRALDPISAPYAPPTPWHTTWSAPYFCRRAEQVGGPTREP
jgi:hypothetical protein